MRKFLNSTWGLLIIYALIICIISLIFGLLDVDDENFWGFISIITASTITLVMSTRDKNQKIKQIEFLYAHNRESLIYLIKHELEKNYEIIEDIKIVDEQKALITFRKK